ncbi:hypothetical protein MTO96_016869 [Rhipicephalus appendiculatus]
MRWKFYQGWAEDLQRSPIILSGLRWMLQWHFECSKTTSIRLSKFPRIAAASPTGNTVTLYRLLDHVDISSGPMIGSLDHMSRFKVVAVYPMDTSIGLLYRFQGLAIPSSFSISEFAYNVCCERAQRMNYTGLPKTDSEADEEPSEENLPPKDSVPAASNRTSSS